MKLTKYFAAQFSLLWFFGYFLQVFFDQRCVTFILPRELSHKTGTLIQLNPLFQEPSFHCNASQKVCEKDDLQKNLVANICVAAYRDIFEHAHLTCDLTTEASFEQKP